MIKTAKCCLTCKFFEDDKSLEICHFNNGGSVLLDTQGCPYWSLDADYYTEEDCFTKEEI